MENRGATNFMHDLNEITSDMLDIPDEMVIKWQRIVNLMAKIVGVPAGLIMRVHSSQIEVFVTSSTNGNPYKSGEKENLNTGLYCETVMEQRSPLLVPDARKDPDWENNPDIALGMIYYLGFPLSWPNGETFGTICILDTKHNPGATNYKELIREFQTIIESDLQLIVEMAKCKDTEMLLRQLGDNLPKGGVYRLVHTPDGRRYCPYVSESYERLFQVKTEIINKDVSILYDMFPAEHLERVAQLEQESIKRLDQFNFEAPVHLPDGQIRWFQWHSKPRRLDDGTLIWDGVVLDITRRKKAENELCALRDELEVQVQARTRELVETNSTLSKEIEIRKHAENELHDALFQIKELKDQLEVECTYLGEEIEVMHDYKNIIGESEAITYVLYSLEKIAPADTTVMILGESGTGKELIARCIHSQSNRKNRPLIKVDCAALPESLIDSELFGHEKGAFSGAIAARVGRFEIADGATIFLDEIGELPLQLQQKLLRVLQDGEYERLGSSQTRHADVRVVAATNRNLENDIRKGRFREDLWYRLNVFPLSIPPLRKREGDIPLLVDWAIKKVQRKHGKHIQTVPNEVMDELINYSWPGNVRELENVIERAVIVTQGTELRLAGPLKNALPESNSEHKEPMKSMAEMEEEYILKALKKTHWNVTGKGGTAELLGLNPSTLRGRMRKYGIHRPHPAK
jgi:PAS domain S-box-containing protein